LGSVDCSEIDPCRCENTHLVNTGTGKKLDYYGNINAASATAWIGTVVLALLAALHIILLCAYFLRCGKSQDPPPYQQVEKEGNESVEPDEKPAVV
jgi:hypothetical protein